MTISIYNKEVELKQTLRALFIYEKITNEMFNPSTLTNIVIYFYSVVMASDKNLTISFEEFTDWLDNNMNELTNFTNWLAQINNKNGFINGNTDNKTVEEPKKE